MKRVFLLKLVTPEGEDVTFEAGGKVEIDFISACVEDIMAQGLSRFDSQETWRTKIRTGIQTAILDFKMSTVGQSRRAR